MDFTYKTTRYACLRESNKERYRNPFRKKVVIISIDRSVVVRSSRETRRTLTHKFRPDKHIHYTSVQTSATNTETHVWTRMSEILKTHLILHPPSRTQGVERKGVIKGWYE